MCRLVKVRAPLSLIYNVDPTNSVEEHKFGTEGGLSSTVKFFWPTLCTTYKGIEMIFMQSMMCLI